MAPINWLSLYILFMLVFMIFIITNYYSFLYKPKTLKTHKQKFLINWKW
uniref:ATP synthase complex subunit 8 n=1 Tax=Polydrusus marginatus TaxID=1046238 RepID=S4S370_9CUCU|nr:ATP synthase F0 subunit 8 [Polydrusus marginatus]